MKYMKTDNLYWFFAINTISSFIVVAKTSGDVFSMIHSSSVLISMSNIMRITCFQEFEIKPRANAKVRSK